MPNWGPGTCSVGPAIEYATVLECTLFDSGFVAGTVIRQVTGNISWTWSGGRSDAAVAIQIYSLDGSGTQIEVKQVTFWRIGQNSGTFTYLLPFGANRFRVTWNHSPYVGQSSTATGSGTFDQTIYCPGGTQIKLVGQTVTYITRELLDDVLGRYSAGWLEAPLSILIGTAFVISNLCSGPPRQLPPISPESLSLDLTYWRQVFEALAWTVFCECVPTGGVDSPYPAPVPVQPPGWITPPVQSCDPADLCQSIVDIKNALVQMKSAIDSSAQLTTLLQRYKAPFAYIKVARHSSLSGTSSVTVPRLVGVLLEVTTRPENPTFTGNPTYITDLGWVAVWSPDGMLEERRLTRDVEVWLPQSMTEAVSFSWALRDGVQIAMTELAAEP